jgi:N-acetylmuramic acid 6-phosphate etherase
VGAGTSGRLGILEAAEMPPTFTTEAVRPSWPAAGRDAALKGASRITTTTARAVTRLRPTKHDVVIGVSASGMTRVVLGGPDVPARGIKSCSSPAIAHRTPDVRRTSRCAAVGPEVIAGSTRLKAGAATKIVLNMLTTAAMVRIGKTYGNLMVDVQTGSEKARDRARRIITIVTGLEYDDADKLLRRARWNVKAAIVMQKSGLAYTQAVSRLRRAHDSVRDAIGEDAEARLKELLGMP